MDSDSDSECDTIKTVYPAPHRDNVTDAGHDLLCKCCPVGRSGHRILTSDNSLISLGGFNPSYMYGYETIPDEIDEVGLPLFKELWRFNLSTRQWQLIDNFSSVPPNIASHTIAKVGRWLFLFGGTSIPFGETASKAMYRFDLSSSNMPSPVEYIAEGDSALMTRRPGNRWHLLPVEGDLPGERYGHTMTVCFPDVYIVGGTSGFEYNAEVYHLNLQAATGKWTKLSSDSDPNQPRGRYRHETAFKNRTLYVFGGGTDRKAFHLFEVYTFNVDLREWGKITTMPDPDHGHPGPRKCHSCSQSKDDIFMVGGISGTSSLGETYIYNDIWRFSLVTSTWTKFTTPLPVPLYFHAADIDEAYGCVWIFGGVTRIANMSIRTNRLMRLRVSVGRLMELAWACVCDNLCMDWGKKDLNDLGIPLDLQTRLLPS